MTVQWGANNAWAEPMALLMVPVNSVARNVQVGGIVRGAILRLQRVILLIRVIILVKVDKHPVFHVCQAVILNSRVVLCVQIVRLGGLLTKQ